MTDIACIGHITQDHNITTELDYFAPGGTARYFSVAMNALIESSGIDMSFSLISREGPKHFFENKYGADMNDRQQRVMSTALPFTVEELKDIDARFIVLGSLLASDFPIDVIRMLSEKGIVVLDAQGFLREVREEKVYAVDWADKIETLKYVDILKVNESEMQVLTGKTDPREAALLLAKWGVKEVLITLGSYGSLIYDAKTKEFYDIESFAPKAVVDATGCGDTYVMGYVFMRAQGAAIEESGRFAAAVSSLKLEMAGPFCGTYQQVISRSANRPS